MSTALFCLGLPALAGSARLPVTPGAATPYLKPFVDPLPIPRRIDCAGLALEGGMRTLHVHERQFRHVFHSGLPAALVWGYDGEVPGPTLELREGQALRVYWHNDLPQRPLFPVDKTLSPPGICGLLPSVRTVVHLHGASVPGYEFGGPSRNDDGYPDAWTVPGGTQEAVYPNRQEATCLWYHDHAMGCAARNNYAGLAGMYIIRDAYEDSLHLPRGRHEIPLMIRSRSFHADGSLYYPSAQSSDEVYGDVTEVNGTVWPYLDVEPCLYRFRFLNASTARSYALKLVAPDAGRAPGPAFHQIGSDGGFLDRPALLNDPEDPGAPRLTLAPAERADVLIDFSGCAGKTYVLDNDSQTDESSDEHPIPDVMLFRVGAGRHGDGEAQIPVSLRPIPRLDPARALRTRRIYFQESELPGGAQTMLLNGKHWEDPAVERPLLNSVEVWELVNGTGELHTFHIHQIQFQILGRRAFNGFLYEKFGWVALQGPWMPPGPGETGWKDTVRIAPGQLTRIVMKFGPYTGRFVYHCHMLEHEDMDMMRPFDVVAAAGNGTSAPVFLDRNPEIKAPSPLELVAHAPEGALEAMEDREHGLDIVDPSSGVPGEVRFDAKAGGAWNRARLEWRFLGAAGAHTMDAASAQIRVRESARRSGDFLVLTKVEEKKLRDWQNVETLGAETSIFGRNGDLRFRFQGRGRVEASPHGRNFVWLPELGDGAGFVIQGPVFFGPDGRLISDHRGMGQTIGNLASQIAFSPDGSLAAVQLGPPTPRLAVFRDGKPAYQIPGIFSKAILSNQGGLAGVDYSKLVFYKNGVERSEAKLFVEAGLAQGEELYCLSQAELENDSNDKEIDLIRFDMDGTKREEVLALRGIKALDPGIEREFRILRPANDIFVYRLKKRPKPVFNPRYSAPNPAQ